MVFNSTLLKRQKKVEVQLLTTVVQVHVEQHEQDVQHQPSSIAPWYRFAYLKSSCQRKIVWMLHARLVTDLSCIDWY
jgi:hypothetical protein